MKYLSISILILISIWNFTFAQNPKTILDYYNKLPFYPYFENELSDEDTKSMRDSGIVKINIKNGYLVGGHPKGPKFTMTMFKDRENNIDYIMLQRISYPGDMFDGFLNFLTYNSGNWVNADSILNIVIDENFIDNLKPEEECIPILPEFGTVIIFRKWDSSSGISPQNSPMLFQIKWNKIKFELINSN